MSIDLQDLLTKFQETLVAYGPQLVAAVVILVAGWLGAKLLVSLVCRVMRRTKVDEMLVAFVSNLFYMLLMVLVVIAVLGKLGVNTTSFAAVIAAAGLAIGLALQGSLSNFAAGVMLIFFRPFKAGDFIEAAGVSGTVEEVRVFSTRLRTPDNKQVIAGNSAILDDNIVNYTAKETRRVDLVFGIGYDDDIRQAKELLERLLKEDERVLEDPAPVVAVKELADSSVNFVVRPWVKTADYWPVYFDLTERVKLTFDDAGISIPYPQRDVHLFQQGSAEAA